MKITFQSAANLFDKRVRTPVAGSYAISLCIALPIALLALRAMKLATAPAGRETAAGHKTFNSQKSVLIEVGNAMERCTTWQDPKVLPCAPVVEFKVLLPGLELVRTVAGVRQAPGDT